MAAERSKAEARAQAARARAEKLVAQRLTQAAARGRQVKQVEQVSRRTVYAFMLYLYLCCCWIKTQ